MDDAFCKSIPKKVFYPKYQQGRVPNGKTVEQLRDEANAPAKQACAQCPVKTPCLFHAMYANEDKGVWGGMDEKERKVYATTLGIRPVVEPRGFIRRSENEN